MNKYPEIETCNFSSGQADTDNAWASMSDNGTHLMNFNISLSSIAERERGLTEICDLMREDLNKYTEIKTFEVIAGGSNGSMGGQKHR